METKKRIFSIFLTLSILLMLLPMEVFAAGDIYYVKQGGAGDGSSWANASSDLNGMIAAAGINDQVWVAARTYSPGNGQSDTFTLKKGVKVYGGFPSDGGEFSERDWATHVTTLSGENTNYHVVTGQADATSDDTRLDGFIIKAGKANGSGDNMYGAGMFNDNSSPTVANCLFTSNNADGSGGGMYNKNSSPTVENCTFFNNTATYDGGGISNYAYGGSTCEPVISNCDFYNNSTNFGAGIYNFRSNPAVANCIFSGNTANDCGGGIYNIESDPTIVNCTFSGNTAIDGGGMHNDESDPSVVNCTLCENTATSGSGGGMCSSNNASPTLANTIFWNNTAPAGQGPDIYQDGGTLDLKNCVVDLDNKYNSANNPTLNQTNVIKTDPKLIPLDKNGNIEANPANAYIFGLGQDSSAFNAGLAVGVMVNAVAVPNTDQRGIARPQGAGVDIGAFEAVLYTVTYDNNGGNGTMTPGNAPVGAPFELPACTFTAPTGKLFMTWAIGSAGSATTVDAGTGYTFTGDTTVYAVYRDSVSRLYAQWTKGTSATADLISDADFADFQYVMVDDNVVDPLNYFASPGSTKIAFRANFLETLSVGLHPVNIVSGTGITYGILEIKAAPPPTTSVPKTGDGMGIYTLPALMLLSAGTIILLARRRKASQKSD